MSQGKSSRSQSPTHSSITVSGVQERCASTDPAGQFQMGDWCQSGRSRVAHDYQHFVKQWVSWGCFDGRHPAQLSMVEVLSFTLC